MIIKTLQELNESRGEKGRGSRSGRDVYTSKKGTKARSIKARKSRVKIYPTIMAALKSAAPFGTMFSTKGSDRIYVISKQKWGTDKDQVVGNRIAKGFTPGSATPNASFPSIKGHSIRTSIRHGGVASKELKRKYGAGGSKRGEERRYAGKKKLKEGEDVMSNSTKSKVLELILREGNQYTGEYQTPKVKEEARRLAAERRKKELERQERARAAAARRQTATPAGPGPDPEVSHTEYEGPSLAEQLEFIRNFLSESKTERETSHRRNRGRPQTRMRPSGQEPESSGGRQKPQTGGAWEVGPRSAKEAGESGKTETKRWLEKYYSSNLGGPDPRRPTSNQGKRRLEGN